MGIDTASIGSTLTRIDQALAETPAPRTAADLVTAPATPAQLVATYARHADELAAVVEALAANGRPRTLTALSMIARALGEQHGQLDELAQRMVREAQP